MTIANFEHKLAQYAHLIIKTGVNIQPGQTVVLYISVTQQKLAHLIIKEAYAAGANEVIVKWNDTFTSRQFLAHASEERLENIPAYVNAEADYIVSKHAARISVISEDPDAFSGIDTKRIAKNQAAMGKALLNVRKATQNNDLTWTVVAASDVAWAKKVFPDLSDTEAVDRLWEEIFKTCRIDQKDPIKAWQEHDQTLRNKAKWLNDEQFVALHYTSSKTDLTIGLPKNHIWEGAGSFSSDGIEFMANMPTEEVFTSPNRLDVNGRVYSSKDLIHNNNLIKDFWLEFSDGKVINYDAKIGKEVLEGIMKTDEGASYLGELALVDYSSPISKTGVLFKNTLFDENASCHLALGASFAECIKDGLNKSNEELLEMGLNYSHEHVDFFIGTYDLEVKAILKNGEEVVIIENGDFKE